MTTSPRWLLVAGFVMLIAAAPFNAGCSFLLVDGPPPPEKREYPFYCSRSMAHPLLDVLGAGLAFAAYGHFSDDDDGSPGVEPSRRNDAAVSLALVPILVVSTVVGIHRVTECRSAMDAQAQNPPRPEGSASR